MWISLFCVTNDALKAAICSCSNNNETENALAKRQMSPQDAILTLYIIIYRVKKFTEDKMKLIDGWIYWLLRVPLVLGSDGTAVRAWPWVGRDRRYKRRSAEPEFMTNLAVKICFKFFKSKYFKSKKEKWSANIKLNFWNRFKFSLKLPGRI